MKRYLLILLMLSLSTAAFSDEGTQTGTTDEPVVDQPIVDGPTTDGPTTDGPSTGTPEEEQAIELTSDKLDLGILKSQAQHGKANEVISVKRTSKSPKKVKVSFTLEYLEKTCVEYSLTYTTVPAITKNVCEPMLDGTHVCEEKTFDSYEIPKRVCDKEGSVLKTEKKTFKVDFRKAISLRDGASEMFEISIKQADMGKTKTKYAGRVVKSDSKYKVKYSFGKLRFKAE